MLKIHEVGEFIDGVQKCSRCNIAIFEQDKVNPKLFKVTKRLVHVKNTTTKAVKISAQGWEVGTRLVEYPNKFEVTTKEPTCQKK